MNTDLAQTLEHWIADEGRRYPLVIVSPLPDGSYLLDNERLSSLLVGLAFVICIPVGFDIYQMNYDVRTQYAPWRGAISIIFPPRRIYNRNLAYVKKVLPPELESIPRDMSKRESEVLSILTHYSNPSISRQHISPELVQEVTLRRELQRRREVAAKTGEQSEWVAVLDDEVVALSRQIKGLQAELRDVQDHSEELEYTIEVVQDEKRSLENNIRHLQYEKDELTKNVEAVKFKKVQPDTNSIYEILKTPLANLGASRTTPRDCLTIISHLCPDRIHILDTAWRSADESVAFSDSAKVFDLLWKLSNEYWEQMTNGAGDLEAGKIFGNDFAAREGEAQENNPTARKARTFEYRNKPTLMLRHLKIGRKDSKTHTMRIHFHWDAENQLIVIGHCGPHLPFK